MKRQIPLECIGPISEALKDEEIGMETEPGRSYILSDSHYFQ